MPRYFFDVRRGGDAVLDAEGTELPDLAAARDEMVRSMPDLLRSRQSRGAHSLIISSVRDAQGRIVLRATLSLETEQPDEPRPS